MNDATIFEGELEFSGRLRRHPSFRGGSLQMRRQDKCVTVQGTVPSYYDKQMVQELIRQLDNVDEVINNLVVHPRWDAATIE